MKSGIQLFSSLKTIRNRSHLMLSTLATLTLILTACNSISNGARNIASLNGTSANDTAAAVGGGNFTITQLAPDATSPGTVIDVVATGEPFDTYCATGFICSCEYTYIVTGVGTQTASIPSTYHESDMIRCPNIVPTGVADFDIRITVSGSSTVTTTTTTGTPTPTPVPGGSVTYFSNTLSGTFSNGALAGTTSYLDLTNAASYVQVQRFQARKREFIPNPMNTSMIDPFQSQNPAIIYAFNFYTTNVASSLLNQQQATDTSWESTLVATQDHSVQWWANPNVFSLATCTDAFCSGDADLIYPQNSLTSGKIPVTNAAANGKRRSSFYLASKQYGVFGVGVQAAIAPLSYVASTYSVIGYGAKPVASATGTSTCPNIPLPPKSSWVKLWNFRATDITAPKKVTTSQSITASSIACDPTHSTDPAGTTVANQLFPSCQAAVPFNTADPSGTPWATALDDTRVDDGTHTLSTQTNLASRIAFFTNGVTPGASACYNFSAANAINAMPWTNANFGGKDTWIPSPFKLDTTVTPANYNGYPWNEYDTAACSGGNWSCITANAGVTPYAQWFKYSGTYAIPSSTPMDFSTQLTTVSLSTDNYTDQLFVVTDPNVSDNDMINNASTIQEYVPRTFRSASDCVGPAACDPTATGITPISWGLRTQAVGVEGGTSVYPLCVLQFYD